jgi:hypothetical protein
LNKRIILSIVMAAVMLTLLGAIAGCDSVGGGAEVHLQNVNIGSFSQEGKAITGIPQDKIDAVLKVDASKIYINSTANGFEITLSPSNAVITTGPNGITISGVDPDKIDLKFATTK